ncbi:Hsp33 family molecular chaperone HslO [Geomonas subterranea]|uniref:33 kDa chaperonin n=1 Tax=Geomonas subterranea TaxID=2847989 RepID=A0ABX8LEL8_9BACT|nr:Hsp33 family molecular chaperone HslO [Geomonas subterranea]QXE90486.1 Hsp33 family molecular chaperone HslO [Geomonas subterranea]QXM11438.1 Hsp33 family molecular chaperone HslO [Geomonas subterranea]
MTDYLVRAIAKSGSVRALACVTTGTVSEICRRHGTLPTATAALGRSITAGALMGAMLKTGQRVALRFEGNGPLKKIVIEADSDGSVRGYVGDPQVHLLRSDGALDVPNALGRAGFLTVAKDLGLKEPYRGTVQLYTSGIAEDLALYLVESEQIPSAVGIAEFIEQDGQVTACGGFLIQAVPPIDPLVVEGLMDRIEKLPPLSELLRGGKTPEEIMAMLLSEMEYDVLEKRTIAFACSCSRERIERVLISMGKKELTSLLKEQHGAEVTCEFCGERYRFSEADLERLIAEVDSAKT